MSNFYEEAVARIVSILKVFVSNGDSVGLRESALSIYSEFFPASQSLLTPLVADAVWGLADLHRGKLTVNRARRILFALEIEMKESKKER